MYSLIVRPDDRLCILPGDYTGQTHDGTRALRCISVHQTAEDARLALTVANHQRADEGGAE